MTTSPADQRGLSSLREIDPRRIYLRPVGQLTGTAADSALSSGYALLMGRSSEAMTAVEIIVRGDIGEFTVLVGALSPWLESSGNAQDRVRRLLTNIITPRAAWAGLSLDRPRLMGIINVTPDSFSDGGLRQDATAAISAGQTMLEQGADILDIGGESTRPGAVPVAVDVELQRVIPIVEALAPLGIVSVDTRHPPVMAAALSSGAHIINDVTALTAPGSIEVIVRGDAAVVLMHMQGEPGTMQRDPHYDDAPLDIFDYLEGRIAVCEAAGIPRSKIVIDPGIGFGKSLDHNLAIMRRFSLFRALGCGVLLGISRKGIIGRLTGVGPATERVSGSLAAGMIGLLNGADILRVHDVAETAQALKILRAFE